MRFRTIVVCLVLGPASPALACEEHALRVINAQETSLAYHDTAAAAGAEEVTMTMATLVGAGVASLALIAVSCGALRRSSACEVPATSADPGDDRPIRVDPAHGQPGPILALTAAKLPRAPVAG